MNTGILFKNLFKLNVIFISSSTYKSKGFQLMRSSRFMEKIMTGSKKRRWYPEPTKTTHLNIFANPKGNGKAAGRRQIVLNHVFMTHIVELMTTGQYASEIQDERISITKVKVHSDFKGVNIYWYKKSGVPNEDTEKFLGKIASYLNTEMCSLQVIGRVPPITFVKDKTLFHEAEIDSLLRIADFGDDYTPLGSPDKIRTDLGYEDVIQKDSESEEEPLPEMKHNVFGLNHSKIMSRIQAEIGKRIAAHSKNIVDIPPSLKMEGKDAVDFNKKDYAVYLRKKREERALLDDYSKVGLDDVEVWKAETDWEEEEEDIDDYEYKYKDEYECIDKDEEEKWK